MASGNYSNQSDKNAGGWHRADIVAAVHRTGTSLVRLGLAHGYARTTLSASLSRRHPRANSVIADHIGVARSVLWPSWYAVDAHHVNQCDVTADSPESGALSDTAEAA